jgi:hypothetical protein
MGKLRCRFSLQLEQFIHGTAEIFSEKKGHLQTRDSLALLHFGDIGTIHPYSACQGSFGNATLRLPCPPFFQVILIMCSLREAHYRDSLPNGQDDGRIFR